MGKRIIIKIQDEMYLIPKGLDLGVIVDAISQWERVDDHAEYKKATKYVVQEPSMPKIEVAIVSDEQIEGQLADEEVPTRVPVAASEEKPF